MEELVQTRFIPEPEQPKGRLSRVQKNEIFRDKCRLNPLKLFHHLYICHDKGPDGSPTYDRAGFALDWHRVDQWMQPQAYDKKTMVNNMEKRLAKGDQERDEMFAWFFKEEEEHAERSEDYLKDHVSKDLGIAWHQVGPREEKTWRERGSEPVTFSAWWKEPTQTEKERMLKMHGGCDLRKDLVLQGLASLCSA